MAVTTAVLSGSITDIVGDLDTKYLARVVVVIEANTEGSLLLDTAGDRIMAGPKRVAVDRSSGAYTITLPKTNSADIVPAAGRLYRVHLVYPSGIPGSGNVHRSSGWWALTADGALSDADKWPGLEVTAVSGALLDSIAQMVTDAETARDQAQAVGSTNDGIMTGVDNNPASAFRVQQDARLSATFAPPVVVAPPATGNVTSDTANLQAAINATPAGGTLKLGSVFGGVRYKINAKLTIPRSMTIRSEGFAALFQGRNAAGGVTVTPTVAPIFQGCVIEQTAAATDIIGSTVDGITVNLHNIGLLFTSGLASTGDGISFLPATVVGSGHEMGLWYSTWENVSVYGHDGNHYGVRLLNAAVLTWTDIRSYGGGGFFIECDAGTVNTGNMVVTHASVTVSNAGTAHGIALKGAVTDSEPGMLNLMTWIRPQVFIDGAAYTAGTQRPWHGKIGAGEPKFVTLIDPDFEGLKSTSQPVFGYRTQILGSPLIDGGSGLVQRYAAGIGAAGKTNYDVAQLVALGYEALRENTSGQFHTAVGYMAGADGTVCNYGTYIGNLAGQHNTANDNTYVGANAGTGASGASTGGQNTALGRDALNAIRAGGSNVANGMFALNALQSGNQNVGCGFAAGATSIVAGSANSFIGFQSGSYSGDIADGTAVGADALVAAKATAIGRGAQARAGGSVAIGRDNAGTPAVATVADQFVLGTANHRVTIPGRLNAAQRTPASASDTGTTGDICWDANYVYVCTATNTWKRTAVTTW